VFADARPATLLGLDRRAGEDDRHSVGVAVIGDEFTVKNYLPELMHHHRVRNRHWLRQDDGKLDLSCARLRWPGEFAQWR